MIAVAVLDQIDEVAKWLELLDATRLVPVGSGKDYQQITVPDYAVREKALEFLTTQRDGRAYQQINPLQAQRLSAGDDPKLAAVLQNLLHQPGAAVELTEKKARITAGTQADENINTKQKAKRLKTSLEPSADTPLTLDGSTTSQPDPSTRERGLGHLAAESHTERNQD